MTMRIRFTASLITALVCVLFTEANAAENFTLSDEGLMALHFGSFYATATPSILAKKDVPGPGVEYEIYFPGVKPNDRCLEIVCDSREPNDPIVGTNVGKYERFELKLTLISINGQNAAGTGGILQVGSVIQTQDGSGGFVPEHLGFCEHCEPNVISIATYHGEIISKIGFTLYMYDPNGWDPKGSTVKLLVEPVSGDTAIPEAKTRQANKTSGRCIYVDANATGTGDGLSWASAFKYLQDALSVASKGDQIWVAEGIYRPDLGRKNKPLDTRETFALKNGVALYGGFPSGGGKWEDGNPSKYQSILSGDLKGNDVEIKSLKELSGNPSRTDNSTNVVIASGTDEATILDGFIIIAGNARGIERGWNSDQPIQGGGLYCKVGSPVISNCIFKMNSAEFGGAIYFWRGNPKLLSCRFVNNFANDSGAGIDLSECSPIVVNCVFTNNLAIEKGGAIYNESNKANIINCTITKNYAYAGGGIYNQKSTPTLANCIIWGNTSRYGTDEPAQVYGVKVEASNCCIQGLTPEFGGKNCFSTDPRIADNDTDSYHLSAGSPCIDAGDNKAIPENVGTDIDNNPRIAGTAVDIGAVEVR